MGETFLQMFLLKKMTELLFSSGLLLILPRMLWVWEVLRASLPSALIQQCTAKTKSGLSLSFSCSPLSQSVLEREKNVFSSSLQAPARKVGLALESRSASSKAFKHTVNPSPFRKVQLQLHFAKWDPGAQASQGALVSALVSRDGQLGGTTKSNSKKEQRATPVVLEQGQGELSQAMTQKSSLQFQCLCWLWCHLFQVTSLCH